MPLNEIFRNCGPKCEVREMIGSEGVLLENVQGIVLFFFLIFIYIATLHLATHSSILAWRIPWTEEPGWATVQGITKSQTRLR